MVELLENNLHKTNYQSSKGNQLKWEVGAVWYKADYTGYEGLAEYVVSHLLSKSTLSESEYLNYELEEIKYKHSVYRGVKSENFTSDDWQIITLERLFKSTQGMSLYETTWKIKDVRLRYEFVCQQMRKYTGLEDFDKYLNVLFTIDALLLNEDRHMHNIAVLMNGKREFDYCRIFDNGACLLSDTDVDYPLSEDTIKLMSECKAKTISRDFDEQLDVSEEVAGRNISFYFSRSDVEQIVDAAQQYPAEIRERVKTILFQQMRKYSYLFKN